jgi:uncharacterized protein (TIGR02466 family)
MLEVFPIFSVGIGKLDMSEHLNLARKIFSENNQVLEGKRITSTNVVRQNANKHVINDNYFNQDDIDLLKSYILNGCIEYLKEIGFYYPYYSYEVKNLWLNEYKQFGAQQSVHSHYGYMISGTYYVDMPLESAPIVFHNPMLNMNGAFPYEDSLQFNIYNSDIWRIYPNEGDILYFNSNLRHEVPPGKNQLPRRSIAFDITFKDYLGEN